MSLLGCDVTFSIRRPWDGLVIGLHFRFLLKISTLGKVESSSSRQDLPKSDNNYASLPLHASFATATAPSCRLTITWNSCETRAFQWRRRQCSDCSSPKGAGILSGSAAWIRPSLTTRRTTSHCHEPPRHTPVATYYLPVRP